jgi:hypothetical protein
MSTALDVNTILILISNKINVLSVLFRITTSDYLFDILDLRLLITLLGSSNFSSKSNQSIHIQVLEENMI